MAPVTAQLAALWRLSVQTVLAAVPNQGGAEDVLRFRRASIEARRLAWGLHREAILAGRSPRDAGELADLLVGVDAIEHAVNALAVSPGGVRYDRSVSSLADRVRTHVMTPGGPSDDGAVWSGVAFVAAVSRLATTAPDPATVLRLADLGVERSSATSEPSPPWAVIASCARRLASQPPPSPKLREIAAHPMLPRLVVGAPGTVDGTPIVALDGHWRLLPEGTSPVALIELRGGE